MIQYDLKGGLFSAELLENLASRQGQASNDFKLAPGIRVSDEASRAMSMARNQWMNFQQAVERLHAEQSGVSETRNLWIIPLLSFLGYELQYVRSETVGETTFQISHRDANKDGFPVHIAGFRQSLDENPDNARGKRESAHTQMQEYLNHTEHLYGIITNGHKLRLLRDHHRLTSMQYLEWDLEQLMIENDLASFSMLYRMLHVSRIPQHQGDGSLLEQYHQDSVEEGHRVRNKLRIAVRKSLELLGNGFLKHPENVTLREAVASKKLPTVDYGQQLRTLVYRLLFLLVAEDRRLVFFPDSKQEQRQLYIKHYSLNRLRNMAEGYLSANPRHVDVWEQLKVTFRLFEEEEIGESLGVAPLGGDLFNPQALSFLKKAKISNALLLKALDLLSRFEQEKGHRIRINYRRINVEEFGAVYESLLELNPEIDLNLSDRPFQYIDGESRKGTGSFYTHQDLVKQLLKTALEPVVAERFSEAEKGITDPEERRRRKADALLKIKVCDPACGSGHFLVAAARALATELAYLRAPKGTSIDQYERPALREVIENCIYGVDVDPDAAELCRLVLWMEAHEAGKPITYLDHKIHCGNSLVGWIGDLVLPEIPVGAFDPIQGDDKAVAKSWKMRHLAPNELPMEWENDPVKQLLYETDQLSKETNRPVVTLEDYWRKESIHKQQRLSPAMARQRLMYDLWAYAFFQQYTNDSDQPIVIKEVLNALANGKLSESSRLVQMVKAEAKAARFFHWPLEFPEVFKKGGFDVLLGNPPWAQIMLKEKQFFTGRKPEIVEARNASERKRLIAALPSSDPDRIAFQAAKRYSNGLGRYLRVSGQYLLTCGGRINTYSVFSERSLHLISPKGRLGTIVPTGIATDYTYRRFFSYLIESKRLVSFFDFENRDGLFPEVALQQKFCLLTIGSDVINSNFGFYLYQVSDLSDPQRVFELTTEDFLRINPNTRTCPVFRTKIDADLIKNIYLKYPIFHSDSEESVWNAKLTLMFNMANDSSHFVPRISFLDREKNNKQTRFQNGKTMLRVYEAKLFWHYEHRFNTYASIEDRDQGVDRVVDQDLLDPYNLCESWYWVEKDRVDKFMRLHNLEGNRDLSTNWVIGFRKITASTNERTMVSTILPIAGFGDSCPVILSSHNSINNCSLVSMFSSLALDFISRQKLGGNNLAHFIVKQLPVIPPDHFSKEDLQFLVPRVLELTYTAWDLQAFANDVWADADFGLRVLIEARWQWNKEFIKLPEDVEAQFAWPENAAPQKEEFPHPPFRWDSAHRHRVQCELDAFFFYKYGFDKAEDEETVKYILDPSSSLLAGDTEEKRQNFPGETFRVLKEKEIRKYGEFLTARLVLEAWHAKPWEYPQELPNTVKAEKGGRRRTDYAKARSMTPVIARIISRNENPRYARLLGRTKMEKLLHVIETDTGLDLGRAPKKQHYGPADLDALDEAIKVGERQSAFTEHIKPFAKKGRASGERKSRYYQKGERLGEMLRQFTQEFAEYQSQIDRIIDLFAPLDNREAELYATLYAEWNNRLIKGQPTDDAILMEAAHHGAMRNSENIHLKIF